MANIFFLAIITGEQILTLSNDGHEVTNLVSNRTKLFSASRDGTIRQWNIENGECLFHYDGHENCVESLAINKDYLFSGGRDKDIKIWSLKTGENIHTFFGHKSSVKSLAISQDSLFSADEKGLVKKWNIKTKQCILSLENHSYSQSISFAVSVNEKYLLSGGRRNMVQKIDLETGEIPNIYLSPDLNLSDYIDSHDQTDQSIYAGAKITNVEGLTASQQELMIAFGAIQ
jgi:WD40 repeat protein